MKEVHSLIRARIDLGALRSNYLKIKEAAGDAAVLCIVKADAYGHGAVRVSETLYEAGARCFGVAGPYEAVTLRREAKLPEGVILVLGGTDPRDAETFADEDVTLGLYSYEYGLALAAALPAGKKLKVHVKLDTGMNRLGFSAREEDRTETVRQLKALRDLGCFSFDGIFSHFVTSDEAEDRMTELQFRRYLDTVAALEEAGVAFPIKHIANSAGILRYPETRLDLVRAGIILYGLMPSEDVTAEGFRPVMSLYSTVTHVHHVRAGETIGYGASFRVERDTEVATIALGYADGFCRAFKGSTLGIRGADVRLLGRVCMDQCMGDVTGRGVRPGDTVTVFGTDSVTGKHRPPEAIADMGKTNAYEVCCLVGKRVPREYADGDS